MKIRIYANGSRTMFDETSQDNVTISTLDGKPNPIIQIIDATDHNIKKYFPDLQTNK